MTPHLIPVVEGRWDNLLIGALVALAGSAGIAGRRDSERVAMSPSLYLTMLMKSRLQKKMTTWSPSAKSDFVVDLALDFPLWHTTLDIFSQ